MENEEIQEKVILHKEYKYNSLIELIEASNGISKVYFAKYEDGLTHETKYKVYKYEKNAMNFLSKQIRFFERFYK